MQLQARVVIMTESIDKPFFYSKDYDEVKNIIGFSPDSIGNSDLEVGKTLVIEGTECTIKGFEVRLHPKTYEPSN